MTAGRVAQPGIDGVLGLPLYRDLLLTIDYPAQTVRFERGRLPNADGVTVLPLTHVGPFWGLPISIAGHPYHAVLDTRSTGGFGLTPETAAGVPFDGALRVIGRARGAAIPETEVKAGTIAGDIRIGRYVFPRPVAAVRALPPGFPSEPLVGVRVLSQFAVTLDQRNTRVRLVRDGDQPIVLDPPSPPAAATGPPADYVGRYGVRTVTVEKRSADPPARRRTAAADGAERV